MKGVKGFQKGVVTNPGGRPPKEREAAYLLIMKEIVTAENWRNLCVDAYLGARGIKVKYTNGKPDGYEDDPLATPGSKLANKRFFADYLIGKPIERMIVDDAQGSLLDEWLDLDDSDLDVIINNAYGKSQSIIRQARKLVNRGVAGKPRRRGDNGGTGGTGSKETTRQDVAPDSELSAEKGI